MSAYPLRGLVSIVTGSLSLISAPALARDYGQQGATFPVIEADLLSVIIMPIISVRGNMPALSMSG